MIQAAVQSKISMEVARDLLEDFGSVVLPVAQNGHAELSAMPALCIVLLSLLVHIGLIPGCNTHLEMMNSGEEAAAFGTCIQRWRVNYALQFILSGPKRNLPGRY